MAKEKERELARKMYVDQGKDAREIARMLRITEKTVGAWVAKYKWKSHREALLNSSTERLENIHKVISDITTDRLRLKKQSTDASLSGDLDTVRDINKLIVGLDDAIAKWNKALTSFEKENRISLSQYLEVMDSIFDALKRDHPGLYMDTLDFQQGHIESISMKLG